MTEKLNYRMERIERLLHELEHEVTRGMLDGEIDETLGFEFFVPLSKRIHEGVVQCRFYTRPVPRYAMSLDAMTPYWTLVTDINDTAELVEAVFGNEADAIKAWERMRRSRKAYSTTLWRHSGRHLHKVRDYDRGAV